jgi:hypothetical protein
MAINLSYFTLGEGGGGLNALCGWENREVGIQIGNLGDTSRRNWRGHCIPSVLNVGIGERGKGKVSSDCDAQ